MTWRRETRRGELAWQGVPACEVMLACEVMSACEVMDKQRKVRARSLSSGVGLLAFELMSTCEIKRQPSPGVSL